MKILWLCSWYPNKLKPFDGDFIQRHAKAVSLLHQVHVIFIKKDEEGKITKSIKEETVRDQNLTETIIYYKPFKTGIEFVDKIISDSQYKKIYKEFIKKYIRENGKPVFVHVHVAMKAGIAALWLKKKFNIPFILSEHWTGYLPDAKPNFDDYNFVFRKWYTKVFSEAFKVTAVSKVLANALKEKFNVECHVIPNVVDTNIFFPVEKDKHPVTKFIHISTNTYQKNIEQILEAFAMVRKEGYEFKLIFYVPDVEKLQILINKYQLHKEATVHKEVPQNILVKDLQKSDALILYSRYETFGCVVIEANACGVPAILSDLPVFREYIIEDKTGVFAIPDNAEALSETIISFINNKNNFGKSEIAQHTQNRFSYEVVAKQFDQLYRLIQQ